MSNEMSALPEWPPLEVSKEGRWCHVYAEHDTYTRLQVAEVLRVLLAIILICFSLYCLAVGGSGLLLVLVPVIIFLCFDKSSLTICTSLFPKETNVIFEPDAITIDDKRHSISPQIPLEIHCGRKFLNERQEQQARRITNKQGILSKLSLHKVGYRKIEMIYGGNPTLIAVVSDEDNANDFTIVLQEALRISRTFQPFSVEQTNNSSLVE